MKTFPAWALAALALAAPGSAQEPETDVKELFEKVEKDLAEIDKLLLEASEERAAGAPSTAARGSARDANAKQKVVVDTIQKILESLPP